MNYKYISVSQLKVLMSVSSPNYGRQLLFIFYSENNFKRGFYSSKLDLYVQDLYDLYVQLSQDSNSKP